MSEPSNQWAEGLTTINSTQTLAGLRRRLREAVPRLDDEVMGHDSVPAFPAEPIRYEPEQD